MEQDVEQHIKSMRKKEIGLRRFSVLLGILPFVIGSVWMYFSYQKVQENENKLQQISTAYSKDSVNLVQTQEKKQELEIELLHTYGLPMDSIKNLSAKGLLALLQKSISANDAIKDISANYVPDHNIIVRYFNKTSDDQKVISALKSLGYSFLPTESKAEMKSQEVNSIWFGKSVLLKDCKLVALAAIRAGIPIKAIRPYDKSKTDPAYKANIIEIGSDMAITNSNLQPLTLGEIEGKGSFE